MDRRALISAIALTTAVAAGCASDDEPVEQQTPASMDDREGSQTIVTTQVEQGENMGFEGDEA
ncbi:hypothetical protein [Ilumatobacter sp.]|uniref:hypothetical protein n=1 Tax=Ilumatobacter sp. TaxID=1967498 RepID=UPI003B52962C